MAIELLTLDEIKDKAGERSELGQQARRFLDDYGLLEEAGRLAGAGE